MSVRKIAFVVYPARKHFHATRSFYTDVLRIGEGAFYQNTGPDNPWLWLEYDLPHGGCFALTDMPDAGPHPAHSAAFEVDSIEDILARLPAHAIKEHMFDTGVCTMATIVDPDGNTVIIHKTRPKPKPQ